VNSYFEWSQKNKSLAMVWIYFYHLSCYNPRFSTMNKTIREIGRDRIALLLYKGIEQKKIKLKKDLTVPDLAIAIQGIITGHGILALSEQGGDSQKMAKNAISIIKSLLK